MIHFGIGFGDTDGSSWLYLIFFINALEHVTLLAIHLFIISLIQCLLFISLVVKFRSRQVALGMFLSPIHAYVAGFILIRLIYRQPVCARALRHQRRLRCCSFLHFLLRLLCAVIGVSM